MIYSQNGQLWLPAVQFSEPYQRVSAASIEGLPAAYTCIQRISSAISAMTPLQAFDEAGESVLTPPVAKRPSPAYTAPRWHRETVTALLIDGNAYFEKVYVDGVLEQLVPIPNFAVQARYHETTGQPVYEVQGREYGTDVIEHIRVNTVAGILKGRGAVSMRRAFDESLSLQAYGAQQFRSGIPSVIITTAGVPDAATSAQMAEEWRDNMVGNRRPVFMPVDSKVTPLTFSPEDNEYINALAHDTARQTWIFGMIPSDLDIGVQGSGQTYKNIGTQLSSFYIRAVMPLADEIEHALSDLLDVRLRYNVENYLRADPDSRYDLHKTALAGAAWMDVEEVREIEKLGPMPTRNTDG